MCLYPTYTSEDEIADLYKRAKASPDGVAVVEAIKVLLPTGTPRDEAPPKTPASVFGDDDRTTCPVTPFHGTPWTLTGPNYAMQPWMDCRPNYSTVRGGALHFCRDQRGVDYLMEVNGLAYNYNRTGGPRRVAQPINVPVFLRHDDLVAFGLHDVAALRCFPSEAEARAAAPHPAAFK